MGHKSHAASLCRAALLRIFVVLFVGGKLSSAVAAQATLEWDLNPEPDVVGYRVHYGTVSGSYDQMVEVGNTSAATISNLTPETTYYFAVTAYNSAELESLPSNEAFTEIQNHVPTIVLGEPAGSGSYEGSVPITFEASAADQDGSITRVEFYEGSSKIGEVINAPYSFAWTPPSPGRFQISARVIDNDGATVSSNAIAVTVKGSGMRPGKGGYTGLIVPPESRSWYSGAFTIKTTAAGAFTGNLILDGVTYRLKGRFDSAGAATVTVPRENVAPLVLNLQVRARDSSSEVLGTLSDGSTVAEFAGDRTLGGGAFRSPYKGRWTVLLRVPEDSLGEPPAPQGIGYGTVVVNNAGFARVKGALADGTPFTHGSAITEKGQWLVHVPLYKRRGALTGLWQFTEEEEQHDGLSGTSKWFKPGGMSGQKFYPDGFRLELGVVGERYYHPKSHPLAAGFPSADGSGTITLSEGNLSQEVSRRFSILKSGNVLVSDIGAERLKLRIDFAAGAFSGSFFDQTAKKLRKFSGVVLQTRAVAEGFFLGTDESGSVNFDAVE